MPFSFVVPRKPQPWKSGYSSRISESQWSDLEPCIRALHEQGETRDGIRDWLVQEKGLLPSPGQLQKQLQRWGLKKYKSRRTFLSTLINNGSSVAKQGSLTDTFRNDTALGEAASSSQATDELDCNLTPGTISYVELKRIFSAAKLLQSASHSEFAHILFERFLVLSSETSVICSSTSICYVEATFACLTTAVTNEQKQAALRLVTPEFLARATSPQHHQHFLRYFHIFRHDRHWATTHRGHILGYSQIKVLPCFWIALAQATCFSETLLISDCHLWISTKVLDGISDHDNAPYSHLDPSRDLATLLITAGSAPSQLFRRCIARVISNEPTCHSLATLLHFSAILKKDEAFQLVFWACIGNGADMDNPSLTEDEVHVKIDNHCLYTINRFEAVAAIARVMTEYADCFSDIYEIHGHWNRILEPQFAINFQHWFLKKYLETASLWLDDRQQQTLVIQPTAQKLYNVTLTIGAIKTGERFVTHNLRSMYPLCCHIPDEAQSQIGVPSMYDPPLSRTLNVSNESFEEFAYQHKHAGRSSATFAVTQEHQVPDFPHDVQITDHHLNQARKRGPSSPSSDENTSSELVPSRNSLHSLLYHAQRRDYGGDNLSRSDRTTSSYGQGDLRAASTFSLEKRRSDDSLTTSITSISSRFSVLTMSYDYENDKVQCGKFDSQQSYTVARSPAAHDL